MPIVIKNLQLLGQPSPPDVVLQPNDEPATLAGRLASLKVIAVNFPKYGDGRGYSIGRLLRERYGYKGELRAVGEVARDHLQLLARCGFDAFQLREGEDVAEALEAFEDFSRAYQPALHAS
jgi:uncharacterized protein (DUF934 family)